MRSRWLAWPLLSLAQTRRGVVAQRLERKTLIHEVVGSNLAVVTSSVLPKGGGWMTVQRHRPAN